jgi:hypothetical protein
VSVDLASGLSPNTSRKIPRNIAVYEVFDILNRPNLSKESDKLVQNFQNLRSGFLQQPIASVQIKAKSGVFTILRIEN